MIRFIIFGFLLSMNATASVFFEVNWTTNFKKELTVTCDKGSSLCHKLCQDHYSCNISEGPCRDCIGTNMTMTNLISEMGRTIVNAGKMSLESKVVESITRGSFVTFKANDVYNVIDGVNSIKAIKRFEKLCPDGSSDQIMFLEVDPYTRKILKPGFVYCDMYDETYIYDLTDAPDVVINESLKIRATFY